MKRSFVSLASFFVSASLAGAAVVWMDTATRTPNWIRPDSCVVGGQKFQPASDERLAQAFVVLQYDDCDLRYRAWGWDPAPWVRSMTQVERDAVDAQAAADSEQAAADAERPAEFKNGVVCLNGIIYLPAVPGASNGYAVAVSPDGDLLTSHWYGSPTSSVAEIRADLALKANEAKEAAEQFDAVVAAAAETAAAVVLATNATPEKIAELRAVFPKWKSGVKYDANDIVRHGESLYRVVQAHVSQDEWTPDAATSLFAPVVAEGEIAEWKQPIGASDAYALGAVVSHAGKTWKSTVDANVWEPGVYGWDKVK